MIVLYPYTEVFPEAIEALKVPHGTLRAVDVSGDDESYFRALRSAWSTGGGLIVVEQDVVAPEGFYETFWTCSQPWCLRPMPRHSRPDLMLVNSLGCTRFSAALQELEPDLMERVGEFSQGRPPKHWEHLDTAIYEILRVRYTPHLHWPPAVHLPGRYAALA